MPTAKSKTTKTLRSRTGSTRDSVLVRFPKGVNVELKAALTLAGMRQNEWIVQAIKNALIAQAEERSIGRMTQIADRVEVISADVVTAKKRLEALHETVRGIENKQRLEAEQAFIKVGDALGAIDSRLNAVEGVLQGQRMMIAAMLMGGTVEQRNKMRQILGDPDRLSHMISDWLA